TELVVEHVGRDQRDLAGDHERRQQHPEQQIAAPEPEPGQRIGRERAGEERADGRDGGYLQTVEVAQPQWVVPGERDGVVLDLEWARDQTRRVAQDIRFVLE